ncbi:MAG: carbohydrate kinase family protein [Anaerolineae bacterium]
MYDLLVVGELNADLVLNDQDPVPEFGQREKLVRDAVLDLGSASAIMACQAGRLGLRTAFAGKVGDDLFGRMVVETLESRGVDLQGVIVDPTVKTGITVHLSKPDDRASLTYLGAVAAFRAEEVSPDLLHQSRHLHVSSFFLQPALHPGLPALFKQARALGLSTSLDPGWDPEQRWNGVLGDVLPLVDVFFPNEQELRGVAHAGDLSQALEMIAEKVPVVVVKLGAKGAMAVCGRTVYREPAYPAEPLDTTGAGDSFNAGFLYGFLHGRPVQECLRIGCICGALSTRTLGGISSQPTLDEVLSALG